MASTAFTIRSRRTCCNGRGRAVTSGRRSLNSTRNDTRWLSRSLRSEHENARHAFAGCRAGTRAAGRSLRKIERVLDHVAGVETHADDLREELSASSRSAWRTGEPVQGRHWHWRHGGQRCFTS
jgi:hypothetical protein